mgnify:CR=1 FL=1
MTDEEKVPKPGFWQIVLSTMGAAFGVQSSKTQQRDFKQASIYPYIAAGIIFTVLFVVVVATIVSTVLSESGV